MEADFTDASLLQRLEQAAEWLGIQVRYEDLADDEISVHSGGCRLAGRNLILIDRRLTLGQRARALARELAKRDLDGVYLLPRVREFIDRCH